MKGYTVDSGYMGYLDGAYLLFADENDYREAYLEDIEDTTLTGRNHVDYNNGPYYFNTRLVAIQLS